MTKTPEHQNNQDNWTPFLFLPHRFMKVTSGDQEGTSIQNLDTSSQNGQKFT